MSIYDAGDGTTYYGTFANAGGTLMDPGTVRLTLTPPGLPGTTYTYAAGTITRDGTGLYSYPVVFTRGGYWGWRWEGTGTINQAQAGRDFVRYVE